MRKHSLTEGDRWRMASVALTVALGALVLATAAPQAAGPADMKKIQRQMNIMENVLDEVLVDSPNFLVRGRGNTRGIYLDEFGAVFTFEASLVSKSPWSVTEFGKWPFDELNFKIEEKDDQIIITKKSKKDLEELKKEAEELKKEAQELKGKAETLKDKAGTVEEIYEKDEEMLERGKKELLDALLEYGETLSSLRDDQWVVIAAFLKGSEYFLDNKISRYVLKARMQDLRAYSSGKLSESAMTGKVVREEY